MQLLLVLLSLSAATIMGLVLAPYGSWVRHDLGAQALWYSCSIVAYGLMSGGKSKWLATHVQTVGFPILFVPYIGFPSSEESSTTSATSYSLPIIILIYIIVGVLIAGDNMLYSAGLLYLSASTYSLICATQLAFNAAFSFFINSQKFTALIFNSVVVLSLSASLVAVNDDSDKPSGVTNRKYALGFVATIGASGLYALLLSLCNQGRSQKLQKTPDILENLGPVWFLGLGGFLG
nr:probable purine permease 11 isoform X2 [Tanacetum cinerariifolium]